jgi:hypothetical protein
MRQLMLLLLLAGLCWAGPQLQEIAATRYVGVSRGIEPIAVGDNFLPALLSQRADPRGHFRIPDLGLDTVDEARLRGDAAAIGRYGGGVVLATSRGGKLSFLELRYEGRSVRSVDHGAFSVADLKDWRVLHLGAGDGTPLVVIGHSTGLLIVNVARRGQRSALFARPRGQVLAATGPVRTREGRTIFAIDSGLKVLQFGEKGDSWVLVREVELRAPGFTPRTIAAGPREIWIGGVAQGRGMLLNVSPASLQKRRVPRRIPKEIAGALDAPLAPDATFPFAAGSIDHVRLLEAGRLVLAGVKDGRAWLGVASGGRRLQLEHEGYPAGTRIDALGVNPARRGWSIAVGMSDMFVRLFRIPGDEALPRNWDPFPEPPPAEEPPVEEPPEEIPEEIPGPVPVPVDPGHARPGGGILTTAILPRVACDNRRGEDTEIVLVYVGAAAARVRVGFVADTGRALHAATAVLQPGQKLTISTSAQLAKLGVPSFTGYVRIEGIPRRDLIVEGLTTARSIRGARQEVLPAHWR